MHQHTAERVLHLVFPAARHVQQGMARRLYVILIHRMITFQQIPLGRTLFLLIVCVSGVYAQHLPRKINLPAELKEVSGMTITRDGSIWLLNDSRNPPVLFRFNPNQHKLEEARKLPVQNIDWEDLAQDPQGRLYIGDFGNNGNRRRNLRIFRYDPVTGALDSITFRYPDQTNFPPASTRDWNFNGEAMVYSNDSLHLFSKNSFEGNFYCKHYVLPAVPGNYDAVLRDSILLRKRVITGAALSKDGSVLALTGYIIGKKFGFLPYTRASIIFFSQYKGSDFFKGKQRWKRLPKCLIARQFESVAHWGGRTWIVANEGRAHQRQRIWRIRH